MDDKNKKDDFLENDYVFLIFDKKDEEVNITNYCNIILVFIIFLCFGFIIKSIFV